MSMTPEQKKILIDTCNVLIKRENTSEYSDNLREVAKVALSVLTDSKDPIAYLTWHQGCRAPDDCEYYLEAWMHKTEERSIDGSPAIPVYANPWEVRNPDYWITYYPEVVGFDDKAHSQSGAESCAKRIAKEIGGFVRPVYIGDIQKVV
ncbi:hypothetical protein [Acinetobacter phage ABPH49]|nr:hypothetical protein [Acinetobacter phage ABPH49]